MRTWIFRGWKAITPTRSSRRACSGGRFGRDPDLILLDLKLPKVDCIEVLKRVKADARTRVVPVLMATSSVDERDIAERSKPGVSSYVTKPVAFEQFSETAPKAGFS